MSSVLDLARPDLVALRPYQPGAWEPGMTRLNANESAWRLPSDPTERGLNVYPPPRPEVLREALADYYGVARDRLLVTRGSSEAFDMYRVYATIQAAKIQTAPLDAANGFAFDSERVLASVNDATRIVFVCSPNNPTGTIAGRAAIEQLAAELEGRALLVIDAAYQDYAEDQGLDELISRNQHVVVLRTLSKFVALAGARCGALIAAPEVVGFLEKVLPPYTFPTPSIEIVSKAMQPESLEVARRRIAETRTERDRLASALASLESVVEVIPSQANFVLARVTDADVFDRNARDGGVLVRRFSGEPMLADCVRITVGRREDNDRLLAAVGSGGGNRG